MTVISTWAPAGNALTSTVVRPGGLAKQVYEADPLVCPRCTEPMRIIAFIEQPEVIEKILTHLGLWPTHIHSPPAGAPVVVFPATGRVAA